MLTPSRARGGQWDRTSAGLYIPAGTDRGQAQQRIAEVAARLPSYGVVTGWAACLLLGAAWLDGLARDGVTPLPIRVAVGTRGGVRRDPALTVSFERLPEWEVCRRYGVRVTRPERAVFDEMRQHGHREALVVLESALAGRLTSLARMAAYGETHRSSRRFAVVAWALARARGGARSPLEVRVRTVAEEDAGHARLEVNRVVLTTDGRRIGEVDLLDPESGTVIEVDGADHRDVDQQSWDITKEEALRQVGLEVARVTGRQARDAVALAARLGAVRARSRFLEPDLRAWQLAPQDVDNEVWLSEREQEAMWHESLGA
ncbi:hypothetical protein [Nocardioides sp.]|uniref:hypothetical protein n=1 Tax=Nocardioides sp. TaxID=35761 RepID=UPI00286E15CE|nr:hypothetical protein [Nocardioides sp.]